MGTSDAIDPRKADGDVYFLPSRRLIHALVFVVFSTGLATTPLFAAPKCNGATRDHVRRADADYERIRLTVTRIAADDARYAWTSEWGGIRLEGGSALMSADPALYQITRYTHVYSTALTRTGHYLVFEPVSYADRTISEIRVAAAPELGGAPPIGAILTRPLPVEGPVIPGYRFQMAEPLSAESDAYLGLWRRTRSTGPITLLAYFARRPGRPDGYETRVVGRSERAFSLISESDTMHGGAWSFTLFTEATCPGAIAMLRYVWMLYIPRVS